MQPDRCRSGTAVKAEHERARCPGGWLVPGVCDKEDPCFGFALGILDRHQPGGGSVLQLLAIERNRWCVMTGSSSVDVLVFGFSGSASLVGAGFDAAAAFGLGFRRLSRTGLLGSGGGRRNTITTLAIRVDARFIRSCLVDIESCQSSQIYPIIPESWYNPV